MSSEDQASMVTAWIKARRSGAGNDCVEMRRHGEAVEVRDSKNPTGPTLSVAPDVFGAWVDRAKTGEFDQLL
jgi:hypothetical protein